MYQIIGGLLLFGGIIAAVSTVAYAYNYCAEATERAGRTGKPVVILQFKVLNEDIQFCAYP